MQIIAYNKLCCNQYWSEVVGRRAERWNKRFGGIATWAITSGDSETRVDYPKKSSAPNFNVGAVT